MDPSEDQASKAQPLRDQYHHYIPRFILRNFQIDERLQGTKEQKSKAFREANAKGIDIEKIHVYDLSRGELQEPPLHRAYGIMNLYRDYRRIGNVDHIEAKLAVLEREASSVIRHLCQSTADLNFTVTPDELKILRKFLFVMRFRTPEHSSCLLRWDWLGALCWFLETPHKDIVRFGRRIRVFCWNSNYLTSIEKCAHTYESLAEEFALCVWEAADDSEFILGKHTFGLLEGSNISGAHHLFVVSPRIVVVLRPKNTLFNRHDAIVHPTTFSLGGIRSSTSRVVKLSKGQTYAVNEAVLNDATSIQGGSITFASRAIMLQTLEQYTADYDEKHSLFQPLLNALYPDDFLSRFGRIVTNILVQILLFVVYGMVVIISIVVVISFFLVVIIFLLVVIMFVLGCDPAGSGCYS